MSHNLYNHPQEYVESLARILAIHLPRHYLTPTRPIPLQNGGLTHIQAQQVIDYIHTHLNRDLFLAELASVVNISPTYFASLFKRRMGISPHQYVIQQRVERAEMMLKKTDLAIRATPTQTSPYKLASPVRAI